MLDIVNINEISKCEKKFGGKAQGLTLLNNNGFNVPYTVFIEAVSNIAEINDKKFQDNLKEKIRILEKEGYYNIAIRSSSLNEDAFSSSLAGHYKTIMGQMSFDEVVDSIREVILSIDETAEDKMGVIIQEMICADYSGVIFSSNPLTYSKRK